MKYFFMLLMTIASTSATSHQSSHVKFSWECENDRCIKKVVEYGSREKIQSFDICKLLCGDSILWPNPVMKMIKGPPVCIGKIQFDPDFIRENDTKDTPIKNLIIGAIDVFTDRIMKKETKVNHNFLDKIDKTLKIRIIIRDKNVSDLSFNTRHEAYDLSINETDTNENLITAVIKGETFFGVRHGVETLTQLIVHDNNEGCLAVPKEVSITDYPKFPYRGIMLDTSRNYFSVDSIKRTINIMSANKLNSFHWHISDSQSFPLKLNKYKEFAEYGAYSLEKIYTEDDITAIASYAKIRGIRVIPELDAPAHVGEGWQSTPVDTILCLNKEPWGSYCGEPTCGQLNPLSNNVYDVLGGLYKEFIRIFQTNIFHMGSDEVSYSCWETSKDIQDWIKIHDNSSSTEEAATEYYNELDSMTRKELFYSTEKKELLLQLTNEFQEKALNKLKDVNRGKNFDVILWTSKLTEKENLKRLNNKDYIIQVWGSRRDAKSLLDNNFRIILSNSDALYLDCGLGSWLAGGNNWCTPFKTWHNIYDNKMYLSEDQQKLILGQEAPLWTETVGEGSLDSRLWPRGAALAERTWTDPSSSWRVAEARMLYHRERLVELGCDADAIEPEWCNINRNGCS